MKKIKYVTALLDVVFKLMAIGVLVIVGVSVFFSFTNEAHPIAFNGGQASFLSVAIVQTIDNGTDYVMTQKIISLVVLCVSAVLLAAIFWLTSQFFKTLKIDFKPFQMIQVTRLHKVAVLLLVYAVVPQVLLSLLKTALLPGYSIELSMDMTFFFALIFFCVAEVLRYGTELQTESDEML